MAELTQSERLQPSLLDRLTDDEPDKKQESRNKRVLSLSKLREGVMRDLAWLLNTGNFDAVEDLVDYPHVKNSVLNFGVPDIAGGTVSSTDIAEVERVVRQAIIDFEPRIIRNTLKVRAFKSDDQMNHNALSFDIDGELWAQPIPLRLFLKTEVDLETGGVTITDRVGQG